MATRYEHRPTLTNQAFRWKAIPATFTSSSLVDTFRSDRHPSEASGPLHSVCASGISSRTDSGRHHHHDHLFSRERELRLPHPHGRAMGDHHHSYSQWSGQSDYITPFHRRDRHKHHHVGDGCWTATERRPKHRLRRMQRILRDDFVQQRRHFGRLPLVLPEVRSSSSTPTMTSA